MEVANLHPESWRCFSNPGGSTHRVSSTYVLHGNTRVEVGVKSMKWLIRNNLGPGGSLDNDRFSQAIMEYRNTPDRDTGCSPAQVVFGRVIRDFIPMVEGSYSPHPEWIITR